MATNRFSLSLKRPLLTGLVRLMAVGFIVGSGQSALADYFSCQSVFKNVPVATRSLSQIQHLRLSTFNVADPFGKKILPDYSSPFLRNKKRTALARTIRELDADILVIVEAATRDQLQRFSDENLDGLYKAHLIPGIDPGGKNIGFLTKRDLPFEFAIESHKEMTWLDPTSQEVRPLFTRDLPALLVRLPNSRGPPALIVLGNHAKSMRDRKNDPGSLILRTAQYFGTRRIIDTYQKQYGDNVPLALMGDFNTDVRFGREILPLKDVLKDAFDLVKTLKISGDDRATHTFHQHGQPAVASQLDSIMLSKSLARSVVQAHVHRYFDTSGIRKPLPRTFEERGENPSDHLPVVVDISTHEMF